MMRGMHDLMQRQQQLLDRSFRAQQQAEQGRMGQRGQQGGDQQDATAGRWATPPASRRACGACSAR